MGDQDAGQADAADAADQQGAPQQGAPQTAGTPQQVRLRRAPRYRAFVLTGALTGVALGVLIALLSTSSAEYSTRTFAGYLSVTLALVGGVLGGLAALLVERRRG